MSCASLGEHPAAIGRAAGLYGDECEKRLTWPGSSGAGGAGSSDARGIVVVARRWRDSFVSVCATGAGGSPKVCLVFEGSRDLCICIRPQQSQKRAAESARSEFAAVLSRRTVDGGAPKNRDRAKERERLEAKVMNCGHFEFDDQRRSLSSSIIIRFPVCGLLKTPVA